MVEGDIKEGGTIHPVIPYVIHPEGKDTSTIVGELTDYRIIDITEGFPANDKQQLWEIIGDLVITRNIPRIPIIATSSGVWMMTDPLGEHMKLWQETGTPHDVRYTTSIESFALTDPMVPYVTLTDVQIIKGTGTVYLPLGMGTDAMQFLPDLALSKPFTNEGKANMREIFSQIEGVDVSNIR